MPKLAKFQLPTLTGQISVIWRGKCSTSVTMSSSSRDPPCSVRPVVANGAKNKPGRATMSAAKIWPRLLAEKPCVVRVGHIGVDGGQQKRLARPSSTKICSICKQPRLRKRPLHAHNYSTCRAKSDVQPDGKQLFGNKIARGHGLRRDFPWRHRWRHRFVLAPSAAATVLCCFPIGAIHRDYCVL